MPGFSKANHERLDQVTVCEECRAIVLDTDATEHAAWHRRLTQQIRLGF